MTQVQQGVMPQGNFTLFVSIQPLLHNPGMLGRTAIIILPLRGSPEAVSFVECNGTVVGLANLQKDSLDVAVLSNLETLLQQQISHLLER
jgi:hypothetical protein